MISLGSGDGRKGLGLGFDVGEEMEETELEEGEACYYQNDDDSTIDPDVALSYIDEKLQDVLGHFQKDFEGGVSAENLGAKFGGYGSFLPTYQRSPASSHPRTPPKVHNYSGSKSPNNLHLEGGHHSSLVQSNASVSLPAVKAPPVNGSLALSSHAEDSPSNFEVFTKSANPFDQKNLRVRIKVSSDNLLTRKNAEIYSGLGLDVSPSSSLDGSPMDSEGLSHEPLDAPYESPTSILQVITSLPVHGSLLLSPLPDDLIHLIEKAKLPRKVLRDKKRKTSEKYVISRDLKNGNSNNDAQNSINVLPKTETDIDTLACEEIVSNALKLPLLSNTYCNVVNSAKGNDRDVDTSNFASKKKSKGNRNHGAKVSKSEGEDFRNHGYKDFFGEIKSEKGDDAKASDEIVHGNSLTNSVAVIENGPLEFKGASRERSNVKKSERSSSLEAYGRMASNIVPLTGNGPTSSAYGAVPPVVKEDWVCCDKCQKWRLLPLGTNPNSLPEKWLCSMLYWLPGFNRCSIPQEETTKAVITRYQVPAPAPAPAPVSQRSQHDHANGIQLGVSLADARSSDQNQKDLGLHVLPSGKKKQELEDVSNAKNQDGPQFSNSMKKNLKESVKSRSVNGESRSPSVNEKKKVLEGHSGGGDSLNSRIKREAEQDSVGASKKIKIDDFDNSDEDRMSNHGGPILKVDRSTSTSLSMNDVAKDSKRQSKSSTGNPEDSMQITSDDGLLHAGKRDDRDAVKKRNGTNCHDTLIYTDSQENRDFMEETSENHHKRDKKATISKSGGEETDKKGTSMMDLKLGLDPGCIRSQRSLDAMGSLKRDTGSVSSSSKVSSSHKEKAKHQEVKGSPVESVSSSPLRISNPDNKFTSTGPKNDSLVGSSPRRCIDGKDETLKTLTVTQCGPQEISVHGFEERALGHVSSDKAKEFGPSDHLPHEERGNNNQYQASGSHSRKSGKSRSKDKSKSGRSDKGTLKRSDSFNESDAGRNKFQEKSAVNSDRVEKSSVSKKDSTGKLFSESGKKEIQTNCGPHDDSDVKVDAISNQELKPESDRDGEKSSKRFPSDKTDRVRGKSHSLPPSGRVPNEPSRWPQSISAKENGTNALLVDTSEGGDDPLKAPKQIKKAENQNGNQSKSKNPLPNGVKVKRDVDAPSPVRRDSSNQAASNAVKEAKDLKHLADRLKNSGSNAESTGIYFQAALKFLYGASLLESCNSESSKHGEMIQSIQMYSSTAKLCEFCAHEYEKSKDMAAAALAYKCMEVAYLRVIYSSHTSASRDRNELQTAMQIVPPGESPSSSASDIENLNHSAMVEKATAAALAKGITSPQVAGNHVIAARNRPNFVRLLNFAQDVNFAMEASRKSRIAFAAASPKLEEVKYKEGISSVKKALDFNFQDVDGLLHMVRVAMEIINR